jgi:ribonuclease HII
MVTLEERYPEIINTGDLLMFGIGSSNSQPNIDIQEAEIERLQELSIYEQEIWSNGKNFIAGVDEVGRGPIAGPVVAAAVILPKNALITGINDSKKLSEKKRLILEKEIKKNCVAWAICAIGPSVIDKINILEASKLAMKKAVEKLPVTPDHLFIDAVRIDSNIPQTNIIKGDAKSISIGAASIIAKCHRDRMMKIYDKIYPGYGLASHAGYPTKAHKEAVFEKGYTVIHRKSFKLKPIKNK